MRIPLNLTPYLQFLCVIVHHERKGALYIVSKKKPITFVELLFFCVWLTGWSTGVAFIQGMALQDGISPIWIFVLSHGGSEVFVLWMISSRLRLAGERVQRLDETQDMDSLTFRWRLGESRPFTGMLSAGLATVTYIILLSPLVIYIGNTLVGRGEVSLMGLLACVFFMGVWIYTMTWWFKAYVALSKGMTIVNVRIESHRIVIQEERLGPDEDPIIFPGTNLYFDASMGTLSLWTDTQRWERQYPVHLHSLLEGIEEVIARGKGKKPDGNRVPDALTTLRGATQEDNG